VFLGIIKASRPTLSPNVVAEPPSRATPRPSNAADVPLLDFDRRAPFNGEYPRGQRLPRCKSKDTQEVPIYRAEAAVGNACSVKAAGTAHDRGRIVHRSLLVVDVISQMTVCEPGAFRYARVANGEAGSRGEPASALC